MKSQAAEADGEEVENADPSDEVNETLARGKHYTVFAFQNWSGKHKSIHFVVARYALEKHSSRWLRKTNRSVVTFLGSFHIYVTGNAYDGASENRTWMKKTLTINLKTIISDLLIESSNESVEANRSGDETAKILDPTDRKFKDIELPNIAVAYPHPTVNGLTIAALADFSHAVKKLTNAVERANLRGMDQMPVNMKMLKDLYMETPDMKTDGQIMIYPKLNKEIFEKNAKNRMRVPSACKLHSDSMADCIETYGPRLSARIPTEHWRSTLVHIRKTNRWIDVMNNTRSKGCEPINHPNHPHVFELLSYVTYIEQWRQSIHSDNFLPQSTFEDLILTCTGVVITARMYLPLWRAAGYEDENIIQRRHGTDDLENLFCKSRGANPNADVKGTHNVIAGSISGVMNSLAGSKKKNCGHGTHFNAKELDSGKIARQKFY